jgi:hypothetical protein
VRPSDSRAEAGSATRAGSKYTGSQRLRPSTGYSSQERLDSRNCCRTRSAVAVAGGGAPSGPNATASRKPVYPSTISATVTSTASCSGSANGVQARVTTRAPSAVSTG